MSYLVLARKYRPQTLTELVGQQPIVETLTNAIKKGKIAHAYLFAGPRGIGKTSTARILAKSLNCINGPTVNPCGKCPNCIEISNCTSLDVIEIDGASNRGIDEIRDLKEKINFVPINAKYKIYIIDEVHMLTEQAFNALLKTLEEPPPHIIFIFATTEPHKIPATILSRCQRYDFKRISIPEIVQNLKMISQKENIKIDENALFIIAKNSDGSLRDAQSALDQLIASCEEKITENDVIRLFGLTNIEMVQNFLNSIIKEDVKTGIQIINQIYNSGFDLKQFLLHIIQFLRNVLFVRLGIESENILEESKSNIEIFKKLANEFEVEVLQEMLVYLNNVLAEFRYTTQFKILLEITLLNLINIYKKVTIKFIYDFIKEFSPYEKIKSQQISKPSVVQQKQEIKEEKDYPSQMDEKWEKIVEKFSETNKMAAKLLKEGKVEIKEKEISIVFDKSFNFDTLNTDKYKEILTKIASEIFKTEMNVKFILKLKEEDILSIPKKIFNNATIVKE